MQVLRIKNRGVAKPTKPKNVIYRWAERPFAINLDNKDLVFFPDNKDLAYFRAISNGWSFAVHFFTP